MEVFVAVQMLLSCVKENISGIGPWEHIYKETTSLLI
jgi:hypothetical protein